MSDPVQIAIITAVLIFGVVFLFLFTFKDAIREKLRLGSNLDARAKFQAFEGQLSLGSTPPRLSEEEKVELEDKSKQWNKHKTGDIYWLGSDLTLAIPISREGEPDVVKHYVRQTFWHASELELGEPIVGRFARLCEKTKSFTPEDWNNPQRRQEITSELRALLHAIAFIMEGEDKEFKAKVPDDWNKC